MIEKHWADKPILRDLFWFLVLPYRLKQWLRADSQINERNSE